MTWGYVHDDARVVGVQVCARPLPADGQSIAGRLPGADGLYVAVTHSGVTLAAYLARLITAELVTGAAPAALAPYRPDRFTAATAGCWHADRDGKPEIAVRHRHFRLRSGRNALRYVV